MVKHKTAMCQKTYHQNKTQLYEVIIALQNITPIEQVMDGIGREHMQEVFSQPDHLLHRLMVEKGGNRLRNR